MKTRLSLLVLALLLNTGLASAESGRRVILNGQTADCTLFKALNGSEAVPEDCKDNGGSKAAFVDEQPTPPSPLVLQRVNFDFDSAHLTVDARVDLSRVAKIMRDPVSQNQVYRLDGHTDLQGDPGYNRGLSQRRAESVRRQLISLGVPPSRLSSTGFGSDHPANPANPYGLENRRVEVVNLSQGS